MSGGIPTTDNLTDLEQKIIELKRVCEEADARHRACVVDLDEHIRRYIDEEEGSPTKLGRALNVSRSRVYQYLARGREKHKGTRRRRSKASSS